MLRAFVLAGGLGTRLRARLGSLPKVLTPFGDRSLLDVQLEWLAECGVNEVVLALGVRAEPAIERIRTRSAEAVPRVSWTLDPLPLGTGGALGLAARDETHAFLAVDGDVLAEVDLVALLELHRRSAAQATVACFRADETGDRGRVDAGADGRVRAFGGPAARAAAWVSGGVYVCEPAFREAIPAGRPSDLEEEVLPAAVAAGRPIRALRCPGRLFDVGTPEGLDRAVRQWPGARRGGEAAE